MDCPKGCGWIGEPKDYIEHLKTCPKIPGTKPRAEWSRFSPKHLKPLSSNMLNAYLKTMKEIWEQRNFEEFLKAGMETLIVIGKFYEMVGIIGLETLYNSVSIAILSAYRNDWETASHHIQIALEHAERGIETK